MTLDTQAVRLPAHPAAITVTVTDTNGDTHVLPHALHTEERDGMSIGIVASSYVTSGGGGGAYSATVLADSPYAYYRLNDASGNPADSSGNSRPATATAGTPVYNTTGGPVSDGGYLTFDGSTEYVTLGNLDDWVTSQTALSLEYWMRTTSDADMAVAGTFNDGVTQAIVFNVNRSPLDNAEADGAVSQYVRDDDGNLRAVRNNVAGVFDAGDGNWHHIVLTYDANGGSPLYKLYVDGAEITAVQTANSGGVPDNFVTVDYDMVLGARNLRGSIQRYLNGDLAEVAFYRTALSSTRIAAHYAAA